MFKFNLSYFVLAVFLFLIEALIALYMHDAFIRPYGGDVLVGVFVYCSVKSVADTPLWPTVIASLLFCYAVEISQYFHLVRHLGLQNSRVACIVLGTGFSWIDMVCYTAGMFFVLFCERAKQVLVKF